jgi:hypothetical protein
MDVRVYRVGSRDGDATITLTMAWPTFLALSCGRGDRDAHRAHVDIDGDLSRFA